MFENIAPSEEMMSVGSILLHCWLPVWGTIRKAHMHPHRVAFAKKNKRKCWRYWKFALTLGPALYLLLTGDVQMQIWRDMFS